MKLKGLERKYKRVTEILKDLGISPDFSGVSPSYLEYKAAVGTATHKAVELFLNNRLDEMSLHKSIYNYFNSFKGVYETKVFDKFELLTTEKRHFSDFNGNEWSGAVDIECTFRGKKAVIDIKTSSAVHPSHYVQIGAYMSLIDAEEGYILHLDKNGKPGKLIKVKSEYKEKWSQLLEIYYSDLSEAEKVEKAKEIANDRKNLDDIKGKSDAIELLRYSRIRKDAAEKEKEYKEKLIKKLNINGVAYNGVFNNSEGSFYLTRSNDSVRYIYEIEALISNLQEENAIPGTEIPEEKKRFNQAVLNLLEQYKEIKETKGSYRMIPIKEEKANEDS